MARSFLGYMKAAFSARPLGMPIPLNWVFVAGMAIAGLLNAGFWLIGAGVELGYLLFLGSSHRFQRAIDAIDAGRRGQGDAQRLEMLLRSLPATELNRYHALRERCQEILRQQQSHGTDLSAQSDALSRLLLLYLQLLVTRQNLQRVVQDARDASDLPQRMTTLEKQLADASISAELRTSLESQLEILQHRLEGQQEAAEKLKFVDAELVRIQEQVELVREQAALSSDPGVMAQRIDAISGSLTQTGQWIRQQQEILGRMEDATAQPPPLLTEPQ
jgi:hypothetical protein